MADETVEIKTKFFGLTLGGANTMVIIMFLLIIIVGILTMYEHFRRELEHEQIACSIKLDIFIHTLENPSVINWSKVPIDLYPCIPQFLYKRTDA